MSFLESLFTYDNFMPHGYCFLWFPDILWLHVIADIVIVLAYFSIPTVILLVLRKRGRMPFKWIYMMIGAFIFLCGVTHLINIITMWYPIYYIAGIVKALTAAASIATAILILPIVPRVIELVENIADAGKEDDEDNDDRRELES